MKSKLILAMIVVLFFASCEESEVVVIPVPTTQIIPLKVGNTWKYETITYDSLGLEKNRFVEARSIKAETTLAGEKWFYGSIFPGYITIRSNGLWYKILPFPFSYSDIDGEPGLVIPFPLKVNQSEIGYAGKTYTMLDEDVLITTPAGKFRCYQYRISLRPNTSGPDHNDIYYAAGVGLVKETWSYDFIPGQRLYYQRGEHTLLSYNVH